MDDEWEFHCTNCDEIDKIEFSEKDNESIRVVRQGSALLAGIHPETPFNEYLNRDDVDHKTT
jgi:hypothetical protein